MDRAEATAAETATHNPFLVPLAEMEQYLADVTPPQSAYETYSAGDDGDATHRDASGNDVYKGLAQELMEKGEFLSTEDVEALFSGVVKERDLLKSRIKVEMEAAALFGINPESVITAINRNLKEIGADFSLKLAPSKLEGITYSLDMIDNATNRRTSGILVSMDYRFWGRGGDK